MSATAILSTLVLVAICGIVLLFMVTFLAFLYFGPVFEEPEGWEDWKEQWDNADAEFTAIEVKGWGVNGKNVNQDNQRSDRASGRRNGTDRSET